MLLLLPPAGDQKVLRVPLPVLSAGRRSGAKKRNKQQQEQARRKREQQTRRKQEADVPQGKCACTALYLFWEQQLLSHAGATAYRADPLPAPVGPGGRALETAGSRPPPQVRVCSDGSDSDLTPARPSLHASALTQADLAGGALPDFEAGEDDLVSTAVLRQVPCPAGTH